MRCTASAQFTLAAGTTFTTPSGSPLERPVKAAHIAAKLIFGQHEDGRAKLLRQLDHVTLLDEEVAVAFGQAIVETAES
jgi:hypothetical protein